MKNLILVSVFMLTFAFAAMSESNVVNEKVPSKSEVSTKNTNSPKGDSTNDWVCCTVERNGGSATVCRTDGNARKACRQARRYTRKQITK